jgi:hypothetical protein
VTETKVCLSSNVKDPPLEPLEVSPYNQSVNLSPLHIAAILVGVAGVLTALAQLLTTTATS